MKKPSRINIKRSHLDQQLADAARFKQDLTKLLSELENGSQNIAGRPGGWRHDPAGWLRRRRD